MKKLFLLPAIALSVALISFKQPAQHESNRSKNDSKQLYYSITKSAPDASLSSSESMFVFAFKYSGGQAVQSGIKFSYNGINKIAQTDSNGNISLKVKPGKYRFQFFLNQNFFEVYTDSIAIQPGYRTDMQVNFESSTQIIEEDKPVIYVYPKQKETVSIDLTLKGKLGFTYPEYKNGWNFVADPDGTIHMGDKKYNYLFWDGNTEIDNSKIDWNEGYLVKKEELVSFFEARLSEMGMNSKEIQDYITYWCPRMNGNEKVYVHFLFNEEYDEYAQMNIKPKPDHVFRVFMLWSKTDANLLLSAQLIPSFKREGFSVLEWGGGELTNLNLRDNG